MSWLDKLPLRTRRALIKGIINRRNLSDRVNPHKAEDIRGIIWQLKHFDNLGSKSIELIKEALAKAAYEDPVDKPLDFKEMARINDYLTTQMLWLGVYWRLTIDDGQRLWTFGNIEDEH